MKLDEFMRSLQAFGLNLEQNKKENSIALRAEEQELDDEGNTNDYKSFILLIKKFTHVFQQDEQKKEFS